MTPEIRLDLPEQNPSAATIAVVNVPAGDLAALRARPPSRDEWSSLLRVTVAADAEATSHDALPAVAGSYAVTDTAIVFTPLFGLDAGRRYAVRFDPTRLPASGDSSPWRRQPMVGIVSRAKAHVSPSTIVDRVYPTADVLPENQLRVYIHFSAPMGLRGGVAHVRLLDDGGREVQDPFLPLDAEFWNSDRTRFTVFFDPGRVKRGILPNEEMGRALRSGRTYTLVVDREWLDAQGLPLKETFRRAFRVGPPDTRPLDQRTWRIAAPAAGTRNPLVVTFPEPLDHGLLMRALGVSSGAAAVAGEARTEAGERRWTFTPRDQWRPTEYRLVVLTILEDLAGNRIGRAFEVDRFDRADRTAEPETLTVPFRVDDSSTR